MSMNVECPRCASESAYFDGVKYVCPDCDYEWDDELCVQEECEDEEDDEFD